MTQHCTVCSGCDFHVSDLMWPVGSILGLDIPCSHADTFFPFKPYQLESWNLEGKKKTLSVFQKMLSHSSSPIATTCFNNYRPYGTAQMREVTFFH